MTTQITGSSILDHTSRLTPRQNSELGTLGERSMTHPHIRQTTRTQWSFTGRHTSGCIHRIRDGLVVRFVARNSNRQDSGRLTDLDAATRWLKIHDCRS